MTNPNVGYNSVGQSVANGQTGHNTFELVTRLNQTLERLLTRLEGPR